LSLQFTILLHISRFMHSFPSLKMSRIYLLLSAVVYSFLAADVGRAHDGNRRLYWWWDSRIPAVSRTRPPTPVRALSTLVGLVAGDRDLDTLLKGLCHETELIEEYICVYLKGG
jgi:hypothetical protein